jgi:hypothetical protein
MNTIQTIDYINAFKDAVNTLVLCSGYNETPQIPKTNLEIIDEKFTAYIKEVDEDIFNIECLINEIREQIKEIK